MRGYEVSMRPGFSFAGRKKGLFAYSSAIVVFETGTECTVWDWVLVVESEDIDEKKNKKQSTNFCLGTEKKKRKNSENLLWYHIKNREKIELLNQFFDWNEKMKKKLQNRYLFMLYIHVKQGVTVFPSKNNKLANYQQPITMWHLSLPFGSSSY